MNPELKKAFGGIEPDLYGEAELLEQLQYNIDHGLVPDPNNSASHHSHNPNYNSTEPDTTPDILGDLAKQASKELVGMSWTEAEVCHERTVELFNTILPNLDIPTLSDFEQAGIDFDKLQTGYEAYERAGLEPQLVFAPINLSIDDWKQAYTNLRQNQEARYPLPQTNGNQTGNTLDPLGNNRLRYKDDGDGLFINPDIATNWTGLSQEARANNPGTNLLQSNPDGSFVIWQVMVLPTADKQAGGIATNTSHNLVALGSTLPQQEHVAKQADPTRPPMTQNNVHIPLQAYLTLQADRLQRDIPPIDHDTWTWANGTYYNGLRAPAVYWLPIYGQVRLGYSDVDRSYVYLGVRLPVWG